MRALIWPQLRHHPARYVATAIAIALGSAFVCVGFLFTAVLQRRLGDAVSLDARGADVVVAAPDPTQPRPLAPRTVAAVRALAGVTASSVVDTAAATLTLPRLGPQPVRVQPLASDPRLRWQPLTAGRYPIGPAEVLLDSGTADDGGVTVGARLPIRPGTDSRRAGDGASTGASSGASSGASPGASSGASSGASPGAPSAAVATVRVVGIADLGRNLATLGAGPTLVVPAAAFARYGPAQGVTQVDLVAAPGTDPGSLRDAAAAVVARDPAGDVARTFAAHRDAGVASFRVAVALLSAFLLAFAVLALGVAGLVIANTFAILLAQRTRELALLRCVGAGTRQVFRSVIAEAAVLAAVASGVGVAAAHGLAAAAIALSGRVGLPLAVPPLSLRPLAVVVPVLAAVLVTVVAAAVPARRATRVAPVAALVPEPVLAVRSRRGLVRMVLGGLLLVLGAAVLGAGSLGGGSSGVVLVSLGGVLSFVGVLVGARLFVPPLARGVGGLVRVAGRLSGRLAADNVARNPARATSTCAALVLGITLVATVGVGAATARATLVGAVLEDNPVDVTVGPDSGVYVATGGAAPASDAPASDAQPPALPAGLTARLARADGIRSAATMAYLSVVGEPVGAAVGGGARRRGHLAGAVLGVDPAALARVVRSATPPALGPGVLLIGGPIDTGDGLPEGTRVRLRTPGHAVVLAVHRVPSLPQDALVAAATARALGGGVAGATAWLRTAALEPGGDVTAVAPTVAGVRTAVAHSADAASPAGSVAVGGAATVAATVVRVLRVIVDVLTGLLAVAVLIALVGIANTLGLSVLERRRETGLLRALGLTRVRVRASIAWEAVQLALVGVVLGTGLGVAYGFLGARALLRGAGGLAVHYTVPVGQLALLGGIAVAAGLLASVLPARRAVRVPPAAVLAED